MPAPRSRGLSAEAANTLFQRRPGDPGYREGPMPLAMDGRRARDEGDSDLRENLQRALIHTEAVRDGESDLDVERLHGYLMKALEALGDRGEDDEEEDGTPGRNLVRFGPEMDERDDEVVNGGEGGPPNVRSRGRDGISAPPPALKRRARDGVGATAPRPPIITRGSGAERDHRADFEPAVDHALDGDAYDAAALFQKVTR